MTSILQRISEIQSSDNLIQFVKKFEDLLNKVEILHKIKVIDSIKLYYQLNGYDSLSNNEELNKLSFIELKNMCLQLATEAINKDLINYIKMGEFGSIGNKMYNALK